MSPLDSHPLPLRQFLRAVIGTEPLRAYCASRSVPFDAVGCRGADDAIARWAGAVESLPEDAQARVELELARVQVLAGAEATAYLLEAAGGGVLPSDDVPAGAAVALWFLVNRPGLFTDVFFHHEVAEVHTWRSARTDAGLSLPNPDRRAAALAAEVQHFYRTTTGSGRFCAADAHALPGAVCFAVRVADRVQLVEGFSDDGTASVERLRPALAVLFAYSPADGTVRLKAPVRAADRVRDLFDRFGQAVLGCPVYSAGERFDLEPLKRPTVLLPDEPDMDPPRVRTLHLRYPARLGRRTLKLETRASDAPDAIDQLVRAHVSEPAALAVCYAELEVRLRSDGRARTHLVRLWPDRSSLGQTPLGDRLRRCLSRWGLRYA